MSGNTRRMIATCFLAALLAACADSARFDELDIDGGVEPSSGGDELGLHARLFACPALVAAPADVAGLAGAADEGQLFDFFDSLRELALERLDPGCLEDCSRSPTRVCVRAACATAAGGAIDYSRTRETRPRDGANGGGDQVVEIAEAIDLVPGEEGSGLSHLWLTRRGLLGEREDGDRELWELEARWEGTLHPALPADGVLIAEVREWSEGDAWGEVVEWSGPGCRVAVGAGDVLLGRAGAETRIAVAGHRVETRPAGEAGQRLDGWVDGRCAGEIDRSSWEIVGPCLDPDGSPVARRTTTRRAAWDDGSFPVRRCSRHHCVALKDISCLRGR